MQNETMTANEAWDAVERLKISVDYSREHKDWNAMVLDPQVNVACGHPTPIAAVEALVAQIAKRAALVEEAKALAERLCKPLAEVEAQMKAAETAWLTNQEAQ
jgi:hypothetical protein